MENTTKQVYQRCKGNAFFVFDAIIWYVMKHS